MTEALPREICQEGCRVYPSCKTFGQAVPSSPEGLETLFIISECPCRQKLNCLLTVLKEWQWPTGEESWPETSLPECTFYLRPRAFVKIPLELKPWIPQDATGRCWALGGEPSGSVIL